jgi:hypothetical protein
MTLPARLVAPARPPHQPRARGLPPATCGPALASDGARETCPPARAARARVYILRGAPTGRALYRTPPPPPPPARYARRPPPLLPRARARQRRRGLPARPAEARRSMRIRVWYMWHAGLTHCTAQATAPAPPEQPRVPARLSSGTARCVLHSAAVCSQRVPVL